MQHKAVVCFRSSLAESFVGDPGMVLTAYICRGPLGFAPDMEGSIPGGVSSHAAPDRPVYPAARQGLGTLL